MFPFRSSVVLHIALPNTTINKIPLTDREFIELCMAPTHRHAVMLIKHALSTHVPLYREHEDEEEEYGGSDWDFQSAEEEI